MGDWLVSADLLARSSFVLSPMHETVAALMSLDRPFGGAERAFCAQYRPAYQAMLEAHPVRDALVRRAWRPRQGSRPGWMADFLGTVPSAPDLDFEAQLGELAQQWPDHRVRAALREMGDRRLPALLQGDRVSQELVALLRWVWTVTVEADWPRRQRVLRADVVSRTARLATHGWGDVLTGLGGKRGWRAGGRVTVNGYDLPDRDIRVAEHLWFIPVHAPGGWVAWEEPDRYAVVYPVTGTAIVPTAPAKASAGTSPISQDVALARLLGRNRAAILTLLDAPLSTTHLMGLTGLPAASVSTHLRVLLDGGLVQRRRSGREVLYWRSALGETLAACP